MRPKNAEGHEIDRPARSKPRRLRELMERQTVVLPGAFNAFTALQIERAGFDALYVSGAGLSASRGLPDAGILSLTDVLSDAATIAAAVAIPVVVDIDTGFGPPPMVRKSVQAFEVAGVAGVQLEDQELPKKCGHLPGKRLVAAQDMVKKLRAACAARRDPDFLVVARTDARAVEGLEAAVERAHAYVEAGADAIFPEALESADEFRLFAERLARAGARVPLVANMTEFGKTPYLSVKEFECLGYRLVLFPVSAFRVAAKAVEEFLQALKQQGFQQEWLDRMLTRKQLYEMLHYDEPESPVQEVSTHHDASHAN